MTNELAELETQQVELLPDRDALQGLLSSLLGLQGFAIIGLSLD